APPSGGRERASVTAPGRDGCLSLRRGCGLLAGRPADLAGLDDQQLFDPAADHGADDVEIIELDAGRAARPQPGHLPGADLQARLGEHPLQLAGLPDAPVGGGQAQVPLHGPSPFSRPAARCWPAIQASSTWVAWTWM